MNSNSIKDELVKLAGGDKKDWRRHEKFKFTDPAAFSKRCSGLTMADLQFGDHTVGKPVAGGGVCRVFVAYLDECGGDATAYVITTANDSSIEFISVSVD